jgi:prefoldin subunit 5
MSGEHQKNNLSTMRLQSALLQLHAAEQDNQDTLSELQRQRETLERSRHKIFEARRALDEAKHILNRMRARLGFC